MSVAVATAFAQTEIVVDSLADTVDWGDGVTTLREAIIIANWGDSPPYTITFDAALDGGTIVLSWDDPADGDSDPNPLWIGNNDGTTIDASGLAQGITIDASAVTDAFQLASDYNHIIGLTIEDALHHGIYVVGDHNFVKACTIRGCSSEGGGSSDYGGVTVIGPATDTDIADCVIADNYGPGVVVGDGAMNVEIYGNAIRGNGRFLVGDYAGSGIFVWGSVSSVNIYGNEITANLGNGIYIQGNPTTGPESVDITGNRITSNGTSATHGVGILIQGVVLGVEGGSSVIISAGEDDQIIAHNYAQGILIEPHPEGGVPSGILIEWNYIYDNGQEGILIRGGTANLILENYIGVDENWNPAPNGNSGVALTEGAQWNELNANLIAYNRYQNVLISGEGTSGNELWYNEIAGGAGEDPPVGYPNAGVVIMAGATENTVGPCNYIHDHTYDGVQVVGTGTDSNEIVENGGIWCEANAGIVGNGRGIVVTNAYPNGDLQLGPETLGPQGTYIADNDVWENLGDGILIRRDGGDTDISYNDIMGNEGHGILLIGSDADVYGNIIEYNVGDGIRAEVYFGRDDSPASAEGDAVSRPFLGGYEGDENFIVGNGGWGIHFIDCPPWDPEEVAEMNIEPEDETNEAGWIVQEWYGYVRVVDSGGNPVTGETVEIEAADGSWELTSAVSDPSGNYGPEGFDVNSARTYFLIPAWEVTHEGALVAYAPQVVRLSGSDQEVEYAYDGVLSPGEPGGAIESPPESGIYRYQYAQLTSRCHAHDLNGNCVLDLGDVRIVHLMATGCVPMDMKADFDGDGDVDMDDAMICARLILER